MITRAAAATLIVVSCLIKVVKSLSQPSFNGGKMKHIFATNGEQRRLKYLPTFSSEDAEQALLQGDLYCKIDGSNGMIQVIRSTDATSDDDTPTTTIIKAYKRLDTRGKDPNNGQILLPPGHNPSTYTSNIEHTYYYDEITTTNVTGKKLVKLHRDMLELVERHADKLKSFDKEWISVEWVGRKFNQTPNVPYDVALAIHDDQKLSPEESSTIERSFHGLQKYLLEDCAEHPMEGLVLEHEGMYWKVRCGLFPLPEGTNDDNPFRTNKENARPPVFLI